MRLSGVIFGAAALAGHLGAYSFFTHYTNPSSPYVPVAQKFDVAALPNKTVQVLVGDVALAQISDPSQSASLLHHIREAARVWNGVSTSDLRVAFGGLATIGLQQSTPGIDVIFDELPPFVLGYGAPSATADMTTGPNGAFVPIKRSLVRLNRDLQAWAGLGPSFHEAFFLTTVHELGHAVGLQHAFVSGAMATESTRSMTMARPIDADDIAGLTKLYPVAGAAEQTGSIYGRVVFGEGDPVHLAEVVAIRPNGGAISALTDPDGRYRIEGIPPDNYLVYVHPLPPPLTADQTAGDLTLPVLPSGERLAASGTFDTVFFNGSNGTRDVGQASRFAVTAGTAFDAVDLRVRRRTGVAIPAVATYSYFDGGGYVRPAVLNGAGGTLTIVAAGTGLTAGGGVAPGLGVGFLGGAPQLIPNDGIRAFNGGQNTFLALYVQPTSAFGLSGARHMVFSLPTDVYVRPFGATFVADRPPAIGEISPGPDVDGARTLLIAGTDLKRSTKITFDGVAAQVLGFTDDGRAHVVIPPGINGAEAVVGAFNADGQNSMFVQAPAPARYTYDEGEPGSFSLNPGSALAGGDTVIEINGVNTRFVDGQTRVGFGTSDIQVRKVWVLSPTRLWVNVSIASNAPAVQTLVSVMTGFHVISQPFAFTVRTEGEPLSQGIAAPKITGKLANALPGQVALYPGAPLTIPGSALAGAAVTIADHPAAILSASETSVTVQVPADLPVGPAILRLTTAGGSAVVAVYVDLIPPEIHAVTWTGGESIDAGRPAQRGDTLVAAVYGLTASGTPAPERVKIVAGGVEHTPFEIRVDGSSHLISFVLSSYVPAESPVEMTVLLDGRRSAAVPLHVALPK